MAVTNTRWHSLFDLYAVVVLTALIALMVCTSAAAQKLYKVVDEKGNISYQDTPPMDENLQVEEKHVDINASKLRRDPPPKSTIFRPNSGSRRQAGAAPVASNAPSNPSAGDNESPAPLSDEDPFAKRQLLNNPDGFAPTSSEALRHHFTQSSGGNTGQTSTDSAFNKQSREEFEDEARKPLSGDELQEIVRQLK